MALEFTLNGELIWDNRNFTKDIQEIVSSDRYYTPIKISDKTVEIIGWTLNVEATIFETATAESMISNYKLTRDNIGFPIKEFATPFIFLHAIQNDKDKTLEEKILSHSMEPFIVLYLRFCYWYGECTKYCNMEPKNGEIRRKIKPSRDILKKLTQKDWADNKVKQWYRETVGVIYELMNARLCIGNGKKVSFTAEHDFELENAAAEVKTLFKEIDKKTNEKYPILNQKIDSIDSESQFTSIIKEFIRGPKLLEEHLHKGIISQKGEIIFLNVILDQGSPIFTTISEYKNTDLNFNTSLDAGLANLKKDSLIPVIISFHAIHMKYNIFTLMINAKVEGDTLKIP
jgi:hypothetical protein